MKISIRFSQIQALKNATTDMRNKVFKRAIRVGLKNTLPRIAFFSRVQIRKAKYLNMDIKLLDRRTKASKRDADDFSQIRAKIYFSAHHEAYSSFPYKIKPVVGKNGRIYKGLFPTVIGRQMFAQGAFLRAAKKGDANGMLLSLARKGKAKDSKDKAFSDVSVSDILRRDKNLFDRILARSQLVYQQEVNRAIYPAIQELINNIKMGKK